MCITRLLHITVYVIHACLVEILFVYIFAHLKKHIIYYRLTFICIYICVLRVLGKAMPTPTQLPVFDMG